ncbi:MAG: DUF2029 domain-containing protein [Actinobacteria bacterium]|nr:DUF2029 domain-containing protein [Actinomycetota bacterium]
MIVVLPLLTIAVAAFAATSLRFDFVATLVAGYVALVANVGVVTWVLSPFDAVTRLGLLVAELVLLVAATAVWHARGRPRPRLPSLRPFGDPLTLVFLAGLAVILGYELMLALEVPPNNWDSLAYHLTRAAEWKQRHGIHWIPNAPSGRDNEFQPLAEQQILYLFVAAGSGALFALPQFVAELAILVAVYGASRRLGFERAAAARGVAVLATFSAVALQSTTAQNDLVAAAFPACAACLLLGGEGLVAGIALGMAVGAKLTTVLAWPVLAALALLAGRRVATRAAIGTTVGFVAVGLWSFVLNLMHTGHVLGHGQGRVEESVSPSLVTDVHTFLRIVYRFLDVGLLSDPQIWGLAAAGAVVAVAMLARRRFPDAAVPLETPLAILGIAPALAWIATEIHLPVHDPIYGFDINRGANEDFSALGAIGALGVFGAPFLARDRDRRARVLALSFPTYLLLLGLYAKYNIWLTRFMLVPVVLAAPLNALLVRRRLVALAVLVVAGWTGFYALEYDASKPLFGGAVGRPWQLDQAGALAESPAEPTGRIAAAGLRAYDRAVPANACVGAVLDPDEWAYLLWGQHLSRRVVFLPSLKALATAYADNLRYVVVSTGINKPVAKQFTQPNWTVRPLGAYWQLAVARHVRPGGCSE